MNTYVKNSVFAALIMAVMPVMPAQATEIVPVTDESQLDALLPSADNLDDLLEKIMKDPNNLDNYYTYAKAAESKEKYHEAIWAYQSMLASDKSLDRVRLDLSLAYMAIGRFNEARKLLEVVLAHNPPPQVQQNIQAIIAKLGDAGKETLFSGAVSTGINYDSNAAAAPNSGNVTIFDNSVPLSPTQQKKEDIHNFASVILNYTLQPSKLTDSLSMRWKNNLLTYSTRQNSLPDLDVNLISMRSGPEFFYEPLGLRTQFEVVYNYLTLNHATYLRNPHAEITAEVRLDKAVSVQVQHIQEYRDFHNSDSVTTYHDQSGPARQEQVTVHYITSEHSSWDAAMIWRHESAIADYYTDSQVGLLFTHTHTFDDGYFGIVSVGRKRTQYDAADQLVSSRIRCDNQNSLQLTAGKHFEKYDFVFSGSYAYTDNHSTIQDNAYDNHRFSLAVSKNF